MIRNRTRTDRDRRPKTVSISLRERGQTTQDFAVGIGVFILAVAFVFSFLPSILTPFDSSVTGGQTAQADRVADRLVHDLSSETGPENELNGSEFETLNESALGERLGLRENSAEDVRYDRINVSLERLNESEPIGNSDDWTVGDEYDNQSAASSARIVTFADGTGPGDCDPACRLVVRMW